MTDKTIVVRDDGSIEIQVHNSTTGRSVVCGSRKYESINKPPQGTPGRQFIENAEKFVEGTGAYENR